MNAILLGENITTYNFNMEYANKGNIGTKSSDIT